MLAIDLLLALFLGLLLALMLTYPLNRGGPGPLGGLLFFFLMLFVAIWAGGIWLRPVGPPVGGVSWLGFVAVAVALALILAALTPARRPPPVPPASNEARSAEVAALTLSIFFWIAMVALLFVIALHYLAWCA